MQQDGCAAPMDRSTLRRIVVVGGSGVGKTTFAQRLAARLQIPHIELDALHWEQGWAPAEKAVFRARIAQAMAENCWVADGNYSIARDLLWGQADTLVWLDYPLLLNIWRLFRRTLVRVVRREELWNGNRETWRGAFLARDSLFLYLLKTYWRRRREYPRALSQEPYAHLRVVRLRSPRQAEAWLCRIGHNPAS